MHTTQEHASIKGTSRRTSAKTQTATHLYQGILKPHYQKWIDLPNKILTQICSIEQCPRSKDITDIYRTFHPTEAKYTFFSNAHGTFSRIHHLIGHKTSLNKFKKIEILSRIFLDHKGVKLETNLKEKTQKILKYSRQKYFKKMA